MVEEIITVSFMTNFPLTGRLQIEIKRSVLSFNSTAIERQCFVQKTVGTNIYIYTNIYYDIWTAVKLYIHAVCIYFRPLNTPPKRYKMAEHVFIMTLRNF